MGNELNVISTAIGLSTNKCFLALSYNFAYKLQQTTKTLPKRKSFKTNFSAVVLLIHELNLFIYIYHTAVAFLVTSKRNELKYSWLSKKWKVYFSLFPRFIVFFLQKIYMWLIDHPSF